MQAALARLIAIATAMGVPGIEPGTSYGTPALKSGGKLLVRVKDADTLVFMCSQEDKALLMQADPAVFYETPHYHGYPAVLMHLPEADDATIAGRIDAAIRFQVGRKKIKK